MDHCEEHPEEAFAINRDGALAAARAARDAGAGFVFYSTEYVFDGDERPVSPRTTAAARCRVYGRSKREGERAVLAELPRALVIRTTVVYGPDRQEKNFVYQLIRNCRERPAHAPRRGPGLEPDLQRRPGRGHASSCCEREARGV